MNHNFMAASYLATRNSVTCRRLVYVVRMITVSVPTAFLLVSLQNLMTSDETIQSTADRTDKLLQIIADEFPAQTDVEFEEYQLNVARSNAVPLDRSPTDVRSPACRQLSYDVDSLPDVSVIVPVFDESWSMLLRALHGLISRTPDRLLREIILVDDFSSRAYLKAPLRRYTAVLSRKIRVVRNGRREGLIRSRLTAARSATGEVLVFLDSHVEVNHGWLPPLLHVIRRNRSRVVVPRIDSIDPHTLDYVVWEHAAVGSLTWSMDYIWKLAPLTSNSHETQPMATPTTIGCALAIDRKFFFKLGAFDDEMLIWGGENLELSIRAWTCAGGVYISPCSRIAHLFRRMLPYRVPTDSTGRSLKLRNYRRLVDVWFDDYRKYYYVTERSKAPYSGFVGNAVAAADHDEERSIDARRRLRQKLRCRSFDWYLQNVATDLITPDVNSRYFGQLQNAHGQTCACSAPVNDADVLPVIKCGWRDRSQTFALMKNGSVVENRNGNCLTGNADGYAVVRPCSGDAQSQIWMYDVVAADPDNGEIDQSARTALSSLEAIDARKPIGKLRTVDEHNETVCLTQVTWDEGQQVLALLPCRSGNEFTELFQYWLFTYSLDWSRVM